MERIIARRHCATTAMPNNFGFTNSFCSPLSVRPRVTTNADILIVIDSTTDSAILHGVRSRKMPMIETLLAHNFVEMRAQHVH